MKSLINEIFYSLSGEGVSQGVPTVFVRLAGCSLRCGLKTGKKLWCDTPYALSNQAGEEHSVEDVIQKINSYTTNPQQIILTGGEPLEGAKKFFCIELAKMISKKRHSEDTVIIRIETNGKESIRDKELESFAFSLDYKLPGSGMEEYMDKENFAYIKQRNSSLDEVKFVIRDRNDFDRALEVIEEFQFNQNLIFSPVYTELQPKELAEWIKSSNRKGIQLSLQLHKLLWGEARGV